MAFGHKRTAHDLSWDEGMDEMYMDDGPNFHSDSRKKRYNEAYGDYRGGYGPLPPLGFGPGPEVGLWRRQPPPPFMMRRPIFHKSPAQRAIEYLERCGVNDNPRNLPKNLLHLIQPQYCGICDQSFDSFLASRMHYISRNHMKFVNKWLSHNSKPSFTKEPLKSRFLYCELCDVQITSKQHGDSHYDGKLHRSIVEGRRNPKNATLLQKNKKERLDQLIRREKKHLKSGTVTVQQPEKKKVQKEVQKKNPIQSELYCDICKTSVTCTDQMTTHLNGKKHLTKEKQHILKMMKGEKETANDSAPAAQEQTEEANNEVEAVKGDAEEANINEAQNDADEEEVEEEEEEEKEEDEEEEKDEEEKGIEEEEVKEVVEEVEDVIEEVKTVIAEAGVPAHSETGNENCANDDFDWGDGSSSWDEPAKS